jgi:large subunit ribosomal protein L10
MPRPEKVKVVEELSEKLSSSPVSILTDYTGLKVQATTDLRKQLRDASVEYRVFKNTLARIAVRNVKLEKLLEFIEGPTGYAFSDDPLTPAKLLSDFMKSNPNLKIKCALMNGRVLDADQVRAIANLPPREVLLAQLLGQMKAPITGLVNVLIGPMRSLACALEELRKKKEAA